MVKIPEILPDRRLSSSSFPGPYRRIAGGSVGLVGSDSFFAGFLRAKRLGNVLIYLRFKLRMEQMLGYLRRSPREEFLN